MLDAPDGAAPSAVRTLQTLQQLSLVLAASLGFFLLFRLSHSARIVALTPANPVYPAIAFALAATLFSAWRLRFAARYWCIAQVVQHELWTHWIVFHMLERASAEDRRGSESKTILSAALHTPTLEALTARLQDDSIHLIANTLRAHKATQQPIGLAIALAAKQQAKLRAGAEVLGVLLLTAVLSIL